MDKRRYYEDTAIVDGYETLRFKGTGGRWINQVEQESIIRFLPAEGDILDIPCGTGRFMRDHPRRENFTITRADYSEAMLDAAKKNTGDPVIKADAFNLPFANDSFDAAVSLRFVFHYGDMSGFFREISRVLKPGGRFIFDTYTWSPFMFPGTPAFLGGRSYIHSRRTITRWAEEVDLKIDGYEGAFLCSPLVYRAAPAPLLKALIALEDKIPARIKNVRFWCLTKTGSIQGDSNR